MDTLEIEITNNKTLKLLKDLEDLQLLKIVKRTRQKNKQLSKLNFRGSLEQSSAEDFQKYILKSREEWSRNI